MKIAFTSKGETPDSVIDARFGRCKYFVIYDTETKEYQVVDNSDVLSEAHGAGPKAAQRLIENKCDVLVTGNGPGDNAAKVIEKAGIKVYTGYAEKIIKDALPDFI